MSDKEYKLTDTKKINGIELESLSELLTKHRMKNTKEMGDKALSFGLARKNAAYNGRQLDVEFYKNEQKQLTEMSEEYERQHNQLREIASKNLEFAAKIPCWAIHACITFSKDECKIIEEIFDDLKEHDIQKIIQTDFLKYFNAINQLDRKYLINYSAIDDTMMVYFV